MSMEVILNRIDRVYRPGVSEANAEAAVQQTMCAMQLEATAAGGNWRDAD